MTNTTDSDRRSPAISGTQRGESTNAPSLNLMALRRSIHPVLARPHCALMYVNSPGQNQNVEQLNEMWQQLGFEFRRWQLFTVADSREIEGTSPGADVAIMEVSNASGDYPSRWDASTDLKALRLALGLENQIPVLASFHQRFSRISGPLDSARLECLFHEWGARLLPLHDPASKDTWLPIIGQAVAEYDSETHERVCQMVRDSRPTPRKIVFVVDDPCMAELVRMILQRTRQDDVVSVRGEDVPDYLQSHEVDLLITRVMLMGRYSGLDLLRIASPIPTLIMGTEVMQYRQRIMGSGGSLLSLPCGPRLIVEARDTILEAARVFDEYDRR